jgi:hypothetical protein
MGDRVSIGCVQVKQNVVVGGDSMDFTMDMVEVTA